MKNTNPKILIALFALLFIAGIFTGILFFREASNSIEMHEHLSEEASWTCSMHPQIVSKTAGDCPLCGMALVPVAAASNTDPNAVKMSAAALQLANIKTQAVGYGTAKKQIELRGTVTSDERLQFTQVAHIAGRIEHLKINFKGAYVTKGQVIASLYAPGLMVAQQELLEAQQQPELLASVKQKLRNLKVTEAQIETILSSGKPIHTFPVVAQHSGYVTQTQVSAGDYVQAGSPLYELAGLSSVWVWLDVYRADLSWIRKGTPVALRIPALPGKTFETKVSYLDPFVDPATETAKARLTLNNPKGKIKPGMLVNATVRAQRNDDTVLSIPKTAVLWTGKTSLVYVKNTAAQETSFSLRTVELGADLGNAYALLSGLEAGEEIAVQGAFSIDAAAQLAGKLSMMQRPAKQTPLNPVAKESVENLFKMYVEMQTALTQDNFPVALEKATALDTAIKAIDLNDLGKQGTEIWLQALLEIRNANAPLQEINTIAALRKHFEGISNFFLKIADAFAPFSKEVYVQYCPMAFDNTGAAWLSYDPNILNPYFGKSMLRCGETHRVIAKQKS